MGWLKDSFTTTNPETGESTKANVKIDDNGHVSEFVYGLEEDKSGGKHGHVWGLNSNDDDKIDGREIRSGSNDSGNDGGSDGGSGKWIVDNKLQNSAKESFNVKSTLKLDVPNCDIDTNELKNLDVVKNDEKFFEERYNKSEDGASGK